MALPESMDNITDKEIRRILEFRNTSKTHSILRTPKRFISYRPVAFRDLSILVDASCELSKSETPVLPYDHQIWRDNISGKFRKILSDSNSVIMIAEISPAKIIGYAVASVINNNSVVIHDLRATPGDNHKVILKTLILHVESWAKKLGVKKLQIRLTEPSPTFSIFTEDQSFRESYTVFEKSVE